MRLKTPVYDDGTCTVVHGDARDLGELSADVVVTDPPYGLAFMGKAWDRVDQRFHQDWAAAALQVLPLGGWLLAFGGTRTWHRLACGIEDAGFEVRDTLMWLYGQGQPKNTATLKPGWEPILLARKPGSGVLQIDACRIGTAPGDYDHPSNDLGRRDDETGWRFHARKVPPHTAGRWPANVVLDPEAATLLDQQSGILSTHGTDPGGNGRADTTDWRFRKGAQVGDKGGASRFFYTAKAGRSERVKVDGEQHPTVKPLALMRWLVRLVTPPGGTVLDPFCGSGSTLVAARMEGFRAIGVEADERWCKGSAQRLAEIPPVQESLDLSGVS